MPEARAAPHNLWGRRGPGISSVQLRMRSRASHSLAPAQETSRWTALILRGAAAGPTCGLDAQFLLEGP